jgi:hypothetical protein
MAPAARFVVTGARIAKVTFSIDGRRVKTLRTSDKQGRYVYTARRTPTRTGVHRVRAQIVFAAGSTLKTKTLRMTFTKCARAVRPAFTG